MGMAPTPQRASARRYLPHTFSSHAASILLVLLAGLAYALLAAALSLTGLAVFRPDHPLLIGLFTALCVLLVHPLHTRLRRLIEALYPPGVRRLEERLQAFSRELTQGMDPEAITALLRDEIHAALGPAALHIFLLDPLTGGYTAAADESGRPTSDLRFAADSPLVRALSARREPLWIAADESGSALYPEDLQAGRERLALLGCRVLVPLPGRGALVGWLALQPVEPFSPAAGDYLLEVCDQAAAAIEGARALADLERRVHEMNTLTRVAQGVNFTLDFDDILELIYAQTIRVIPAGFFCLLLREAETGRASYPFYLVDDERRPERENRPLDPGDGLDFEVLRSGRALCLDDFESECRRRGLTPPEPGLGAWMCVPLNDGSRTIGALSLGTRDPGQIYTAGQLNLLQAIADQAAGAIVKARLLQETERRARQLALLNEISRSLTSTLELRPLLNQILNSAAEIIGCEAGSLFLLDETSGELVFEVVLGPVAADLTGRRLPPGTGVVGEVVTSKKAIIANNARTRSAWSSRTDRETGFSTQDLLAAPLLVKGRVIGVIELLNKTSGLPFTTADQDLLTTFSSQAAIAIENARLYTLTDQALASRVEELSVMQRIDQELNASLDTQRAPQITLDWAMRQSRAIAGLVGLVEDGHVEIAASSGYAGAPAVELRPVLAELQDGPQQVLRRDASSGSLLHPDAREQVILPIRHEGRVTGLLLLEATVAGSFSEERLAFLARLSDHAAIAIANARLYRQVQEANLAKSQFVSFVAHELKNPMASIKGYTELVAGGMAGPVTDMQASFLATVRANVDRMNTIVSDLNDLTKIQVGRLRLDFKAVRVEDAVDEAVRLLRRQLDEKEQHLEQDLSPGLPPVWADPLRLGQILTNLLSNAHKYTPQGGSIRIGARVPPDEPGCVHIWVQDTGIGISEEDQAGIFQQYFRADAAKEMASGTGLGLNITRSLVEMQGGRIWFESRPGQGSTFHFTTPVAEVS